MSATSSVQVFEGDLPRADVERCVERQFGYSRLLRDDLRRDGELTVATTMAGTVYAGRRGRFVVVGKRADVLAALEAKPTRFWSDALAELQRQCQLRGDRRRPHLREPPPGPHDELEARPRFDPEAMDAARAPVGPAPRARRIRQGAGADRRAQGPRVAARAASRAARAYDGKFAGRVELRYATADEATRAGRALAAGAFPIELEPAFASALAKLQQTIDGTTLFVRFDETRFPGVELDKLQAWRARAQAAATQP